MIFRTALLSVSVILLNCSNPNVTSTDNEKTISNTYKANYIEVVQMSLKEAVVDKNIEDYGFIKDKKNIILYDTLIDKNILPVFDSVSVTIMSKDSIKSYANKNGDFVYLRFKEFDEINDSTYNVLLVSSWMTADNSKTIHLSGGGSGYKYVKTNGIWTKILLYTMMS
jgi:hypothetical protein